MVGKPGRSGRPKGSLSWFKNPVNIAAHNLSVLMELWLAGAPIPTGPNRYLPPPTKRRRTVPPKIKRALANIAIAKTLHDDARNIAAGNSLGQPMSRPQLSAVLGRVRRRAPIRTLRRKVRPA